MSETLPLKDFIQRTLIDICEAVESSREEYDYIAPQHSDDPNDGKTTLIEFDVAVAVSKIDATSQGMGGKIKSSLGIGVLGLGANIGGSVSAKKQNSSENESSQISRIKFNIPVHFRYSKALKEQKEKRRSDNLQGSPIKKSRLR